jgi:hypothetical protein
MSNELKIDMVMERLGFCNCGRPEAALLSIKRCLEFMGTDTPYPVTPCEWVIVYFLEREGYLEHGSNIIAAWVTPSGEALLAEIGDIEL